MKKTLITVVLCVATALAAPVTAMAKTSYISVKNNFPQSKPVSYSYDTESGAESSKSIKSLMTKLEELERQDSVVQTLTVTSESDGSVPVSVKLRLSLPSGGKDNGPDSPQKYDSETLDYYDIKVTSADGTVLYDDADAPETEENAAYRDVSLGMMNEHSGAENKIFNVTVSVDKDMKDYERVAERLDWSIVTEVAQADVTPAPDADKQDSDTLPDAESTVPPAEATASPSPVPSAAPKTGNGVMSAGNYVVGRDIQAGRYTMTGSGKVHVYTNEGILRMTIALKRKGDSSANGVEEYILTVNDGETVGVENEITLSPFRASTATPNPNSSPSPQSKATPSPKPTASPKPTPTPKPTATPKPNGASSQNPKTGDTTPVVLISVIGAAALLSAAALAVLKRKIRK